MRIRDGLYLLRGLRLTPVPEDGNYRGINIVNDGPAEGVPEPGGLPGAEPGTMYPDWFLRHGVGIYHPPGTYR